MLQQGAGSTCWSAAQSSPRMHPFGEGFGGDRGLGPVVAAAGTGMLASLGSRPARRRLPFRGVVQEPLSLCAAAGVPRGAVSDGSVASELGDVAAREGSRTGRRPRWPVRTLWIKRPTWIGATPRYSPHAVPQTDAARQVGRSPTIVQLRGGPTVTGTWVRRARTEKGAPRRFYRGLTARPRPPG
jgi:hypothetical protein